MKSKLFVGAVFLVLVPLLMSGCGIPQDKYDQVVAEKDSLQNSYNTSVAQKDALQDELDTAVAEKDSLQNELGTAITEKDTLRDELDTAVIEKNTLLDRLNEATDEKDALQDELNTTVTEKSALQDQLTSATSTKNSLQAELNKIKAIYPPGDFESVSELEDWVSENIQPTTLYSDQAFRSALKVQQSGLDDGYLISVIYDLDDTKPDYGWIYCGTLANGRFYVWDPEEGIVYDWYDWLVK